MAWTGPERLPERQRPSLASRSRSLQSIRSPAPPSEQSAGEPSGQIRPGWRRRFWQQQQRHRQLNKVADSGRIQRRRLAAAGRTSSLDELAELGEPASGGGAPKRAEEEVRRVTDSCRLLDLWLPPRRWGRPASWSRAPQARGKYGESLAHILLVKHSNEHLILLLLLLQLWPALLCDVFESLKFKGLGCLHLVISKRNGRLLEHLLRFASAEQLAMQQLVHQQVSGTLFRSPQCTSRGAGSSPSSWSSSDWAPEAAREPPRGRFWCDRLSHWPTANGSDHLLLFDRICARARADGPPSAGSGGPPNLPIYLGRLPLAWAVSFDSRQMYEQLVGAGASQAARDLEGDTCLHHLVLNDLRGWTRFLAKSGADLEQPNSAGLSPFLLACHLGRVELFDELLELSAVEFWSYSSVRCSGYPLRALDCILTAPSERSAVSVILESEQSTKEQKSALLSSAVVKKLLEEKWRVFARRLFYRNLILLLLHLLLLTLSVALRPSSSSQPPGKQVASVGGPSLSRWAPLVAVNRQDLVSSTSPPPATASRRPGHQAN